MWRLTRRVAPQFGERSAVQYDGFIHFVERDDEIVPPDGNPMRLSLQREHAEDRRRRELHFDERFAAAESDVQATIGRNHFVGRARQSQMALFPTLQVRQG
ncbi:MAG: hypothetical protein IPI85_07675 [Dehalococcoidia bacterium]|nr:hypothetical protein [Dehalococcoidia bacterium]